MPSAVDELYSKAISALTDPAASRNATLVANDGIIATAGMLEGFAGAGANDATLMTAATVATIAGMITAASAKWVEAVTEREVQLAAVAEERAEYRRQPETELAELAAYYEEKGLNPDLARQVATELMRRSPLKAKLESDHGIVEVMSRLDVARTSLASAAAYALGAAIPLSITVAVPVRLEAGVILAAVVASLTVTSIIGARAGHLNVMTTLMRTLAIGIGTIGVSYIAGRIVF